MNKVETVSAFVAGLICGLSVIFVMWLTGLPKLLPVEGVQPDAECYLTEDKIIICDSKSGRTMYNLEEREK